MPVNASALVRFGIPGIALLAVALIALAVWRSAGARSAVWLSLGAAAWLAFSAVLASSGFFAKLDTLPPRPLFLLVPTLALPFWLGFSRVGSALARAPLLLLVGLQAFRLPLELVMHRAATEGTMPAQLTYSGFNFDIATGVTALLVALLLAMGRAPHWLVWAWNALGTALLVAVVTIAVASLPNFAAFGHEPERLNTWVTYFPFVWLPAGCVSAAVLGHVALWRRLASETAKSPASAAFL
jgi:hypothetical protein